MNGKYKILEIKYFTCKKEKCVKKYSIQIL